MSLPFSQALFDVDEVYTLEERIEQQEINDESLETKKKKKKKKKATSPVENKTPCETIDSAIAEKKSSLLVPSTEVVNALSKETYNQEGISSMGTDSRGLHAVSACESDSQPNTECLPSNVKPQFLHSSVRSDCNNFEGNSEGYSVCDHSMDTSDDESSTPSAQALSVALRTAILPFVHAEGSLLTQEKTNDVGKCSSKQYKDTRDSNANNELVLNDSGSRTREPKSLDLICTSMSGHSKGIRETNASVADVVLSDGEVTTQTQQCDFEEKNKQEAVNGNTLLRQTDGENIDIINAVRNSNDLGVSPSITKEQHTVISVDAHESDFAVLEDGSTSVDTNNAVNTLLEHKSAGFSEEVKENSVVFVDGSRLVNENNGIRLEDQQKELQNGREQNELSAGTNRDSPLIEHECFELGESESCLNGQSQNNDEYVPCSKEVDKEVCDMSLNAEEVIHGVSSEAVFYKSKESFGMKCATEEEENNEGSSHVKVRSQYNVDDIEPSGNLALHVLGMTQLKSEWMKSAVDTKEGSMDVPKSESNDTSAVNQVSTQIETVSQLELKTVQPLKTQDENIYRPTDDCENTEALEIFQGATLEGIKLTECELSSSTKVADGLADTTSSFNLQGSQVSKRLRQVETFPTLCVNAEASCSKPIEMHFQSFSSSCSVDLQTDSSSDSFISNIEGTNDTPMASDGAVESYSTLTGVSDDAHISQGLREHGVGGTQQVSLMAMPSNREVLSEERKRLDLTWLPLEHSVFVSEKHLKGSDTLLKENEAVSSDKQCSALELSSDKVLCKDEQVSPNTHVPESNREENERRQVVSKEFGHYDEQLEKMPETRTSETETDEHVTQVSETEVSRDYSVQNKDGKADDVELIQSLESRCSSSSSRKGSAGTFASVDNERDSNISFYAVVNLQESGNSLKADVWGTIGLNSSSEHPATKYSEKNGAELTRDKVINEEQTKDKPRVPMTNRIDESKRRVDDDKEEGEITSDEDDTSETNKHTKKEREEGEITSDEDDTSETNKRTKKEREEGELSSSDSNEEASPHEKHGGACVPSSELTQNKSVFIRKEKELYPPRRHSLSEVPHKLSKERSRVPENSRSDKTASSSCIKKTDLRTKLSEARQTRSSLKGGRTRVSNETRGDRPRETPVEKRVKRNSSGEKPRQGQSTVRDTTKTGNKANVKSSRPQRASQVRRRETGQRSTGASNETKLESNQRRDETTESSLNSIDEAKGKCDISLQGDDVKAKKLSPITSRQKIDDRCDTSQVDPNKTSKDSTVLRETQGNRKTRKSRSDQRSGTKVKGKEPMINLDASVAKKTRDCKRGDGKTVKDSRVVSRPKVKTNACPQVSESRKAPSRVKKEKMKINTTAKLSLNERDKHRNESWVGSSIRPHSDNETTTKKACVLTRSKRDNKKYKGGEKTSSTLLISEGKAQNKPKNSSKATIDTKAMEMKHGHSGKGKSKGVKTPVKASPRITPRKVLKKLPSNASSKAKVQSPLADKDKVGNTRKRSRAVDITELRQAKKPRLEEGNDCSSKFPVDASTTEKPKPLTKRGEYNNRENQPHSFKLELCEHKEIPPVGEKLKTADEEMCIDGRKVGSYNRTLSKTLLTGDNKRLVFKQRHVNQLFIRGDNVVMVAYDK